MKMYARVWKKRNDTRESIGMKENRCLVGFLLVNSSWGAVFPIRRMGIAARPMSATRYWLSLGSVPI